MLKLKEDLCMFCEKEFDARVGGLIMENRACDECISTNWIRDFIHLHYEPEHEKGQICWCNPKTMVRTEEGERKVECACRVIQSDWGYNCAVCSFKISEVRFNELINDMDRPRARRIERDEVEDNLSGLNNL